MNTDALIVGYDGTPDSDLALTWAATTASQTGGSVVVTIARDPLDNPKGVPWPESYWADVEDRARGLLTEGPDIEWKVEHHVGLPVGVLIDRAGDSSAIVVGSRGHGAIGEIFLGSVSQGVAGRAHTPVIVVRPQQNPESHRIVVGVDGSEADARALDFACARAARTGEKVLALNAWFPTRVAYDRYGYVPPLTGETAVEAQAALDEIIGKARAGHPDVKIEGVIQGTAASRALVGASADASMLVVGSHGHGGVARVLLGSTCHDVLHHAHCPVAVVR